MTAAIVALTLFVAAPSPPPPVVTTVCEVAQEPAQFEGRTLKIRAGVRAGAHHELFLNGPSCGRVIPVEIAGQAAETPEVKHLLNLVFLDFHAGVDRAQAIGTFVGRVRVAKHAPPNLSFQASAVSSVDAYAR